MSFYKVDGMRFPSLLPRPPWLNRVLPHGWLLLGLWAFETAGVAQDRVIQEVHWRSLKPASPGHQAACRLPLEVVEFLQQQRQGGFGRRLPYSFDFPPVGAVLHQDMQMWNLVDLWPWKGETLDYQCGHLTYDGHDGLDWALRTFDEQDRGVPIFAPMGGRVYLKADGAYDKNTTWEGQATNYLLIDHGGGRWCYYGHLKRHSLKVEEGEWIPAGYPIAEIGSSGSSGGPHLHFSTYDKGFRIEPFAGECQPHASAWRDQQDISRELRLYEGAVTAQNPEMHGGPPWPMPRGGQIEFRDGSFYLWVFGSQLPAFSRWQVKCFLPDGSLDWASHQNPFFNPRLSYFFAYWNLRPPSLQQVAGTWTVELWIENQQVGSFPFEVSADGGSPGNRPPHSMQLQLEPAVPEVGDVLRANALASVLLDDPDYDVVQCHFRWWLDGELVRDVLQAGQSDQLHAGLARSGQELKVEVRPFDGSEYGPGDSLQTTLPGSRLELELLGQAQAGQPIQFQIRGAEAGASVDLYWADGPGFAPLPVCRQIQLWLHRPLLFRSQIANALGETLFQETLPAAFSGRILWLQAWSDTGCALSNRLRLGIP